MQKFSIYLSFIIPVYNVEDYLEECIDSILHQFTESCELILVDDGSTDRSGAICDEYAVKYKSVIVIHQKNAGLSSARNTGLANASGKYVTFIDSDDRIASQCASMILSWVKTETVDLCFMKTRKVFPDGVTVDQGEHISCSGLKGKTQDQAIKYLSLRPKYPGSAWAKLYRRDYLVTNRIKFPDDQRICEDLGFVRDSILCAITFDSLDCEFYEYRQKRSGSITYKMDEKNIYGLQLFIDESIAILCKDKRPKSRKNAYVMSFIAYEYFVLLALISGSEGEKYTRACSYVRENQWVVRYSRSFRAMLLSIFISLFGVNRTIKLLSLYVARR